MIGHQTWLRTGTQGQFGQPEVGAPECTAARLLLLLRVYAEAAPWSGDRRRGAALAGASLERWRFAKCSKADFDFSFDDIFSATIDIVACFLQVIIKKRFFIIINIKNNKMKYTIYQVYYVYSVLCTGTHSSI